MEATSLHSLFSNIEHFGNEPVTSGDEGKDDEEEAEDTFVELSPK